MPKFKYFLLAFISLISTGISPPPPLSPQSIERKTRDILHQHVLYKEWSPLLLSRTIERFIHLLDPSKTYLLHEEVSPHLSLSEDVLKEQMEKIQNKDFSLFYQIYHAMLGAITRREEIENGISLKKLPKDVDIKEFEEIEWAKSTQELTTRITRIRSLQWQSTQDISSDNTDISVMESIKKNRQDREKEILQTSPLKQRQQAHVYFLKAFCSSLDNHTSYFTPFEAEQFMIQLRRSLSGIGAQLKDSIHGLVVNHIIKGSPAANSSLKVGDRIIAVNGSSIIGWSLKDAVELIRGPKGSRVSLTVTSEEKKKYDIPIVRGDIVLEDERITANTIPFGNGVIGHLHLFSFYQSPTSSAADLKKVIQKWKKEENLLGIILDLRDNGGGLIDQAVEVSGLFLKRGIIVSTQNTRREPRHWRNLSGTIAWGGPLIVLTNRASASASEIVAQSLQDYKRAIIVGDDQTFGKGSYQSYTGSLQDANQINQEGEYKVTNALYYSVSGKSPQLEGVKADIEVPGYLSSIDIGERFFSYPLPGDRIPPNFEDTFADIPKLYQKQLQFLYSCGKQELTPRYTLLTPLLKEHSTKRAPKPPSQDKELPLASNEDSQLDETVQIMKDLITLDELESAQAS